MGMLCVKSAGKWGFINLKGEIMLPFVYNEVGNFTNTHIEVKRFGLWHYINKEGKMIFPPKP